MIRALIAAFFVLLFATSAHAQAQQQLSLSLIRAVRVSDTAITLSFRTDVPSIGQVLYSTADGSKFTLTDSVPQTDHLFTIDQLDPAHGYSFALSASAAGAQTDTYTVLLAPESIGVPGSSMMPGVQETNAAGNVVSTMLAASSTPAPTESVAPWWAFALLFVVVVGGWLGYARYQRALRANVPPASL